VDGSPSAIDRWSDSLNFRVASLQSSRRLRDGALTQLRLGVLPDPDPLYFAIYTRSVLNGWEALMLPSTLLMIGLAYVGDRIGGREGSTIGLALGLLPTGACLVGIFDAAWRHRYAKNASRLFIEAGDVVDDRVRRLIRIARTRDATIVLQVLGGVIAAVIALTY
jgi:hypothetical protein